MSGGLVMLVPHVLRKPIVPGADTANWAGGRLLSVHVIAVRRMLFTAGSEFI